MFRLKKPMADKNCFVKVLFLCTGAHLLFHGHVERNNPMYNYKT